MKSSLGNIGRYYLSWLMVLVFPLGLLQGTTVVVYAHGGDANFIHACVKGGKIRLVGPNDICSAKETPLDWSITGPVGPQGPQGPQGPAGDSVVAGQTCPPGEFVIGFDASG